MNAEAWRRYLELWQREWLSRVDDVEVVRAEPATDTQIAAAEQRVGLSFPPSYRAFLSVANGWGPASPFIDRLFHTDELDRFATLNPDWVDAYGGGDELATLVQISEVGDSAVLLLNPTVVGDDGEWEAWFFATWGPDEDRFPSFAELMRTQRAEFERLVEPRPQSARQLERAVRQARAAALAGEVDGAQQALETATASGHRTARILLVQLLAFQHRWDEVFPHIAAVLAATWEGPGNAFDEDLCPTLLRAARETGRWDAAEEAIAGSSDPKAAERHRLVYGRLLGEMRERGGIDCHFPDLPNEGFDIAVQRAKSLARGGRLDDAYACVLEALPSWTPIRLDQLAPTPLVADRDLSQTLTEARGREILSTARGGSIAQ